MPINCATTTKATEIALCGCKTSTDTYKRLVDSYDIENTQYAANDASYKRWLGKHNDWKNITGDYDRFKNKDFQQEIGSDQCWGRPRGNGDWHCAEAAGKKNLPYSGDWKDIGQDSCCDSCGWAWAKDTFKCKRSQDSINNANNDWKNNEPKSDPNDGNKVWLNAAAPQPPVKPGYSGTCCAQVLGDITSKGGNISIDNISQSCGNNGGGGGGGDGGDDGGDDDDKILGMKKNVAIGVIAGIFICICMFSVIMMMMMGDEE